MLNVRLTSFFRRRRLGPWAICMMLTTVASVRAGGLTDDQEQTLRCIARGETRPWPEISRPQAQALLANAEQQLHRTETYCTPHGQVADMWWYTKQRERLRRYDGIGDSTAYTGHYLAAMALRYRVEPGQETLQKINTVLATYEVLTRVSGRDGYIARFYGPADDKGYEPYYAQYGRGPDPDRPGLGKWAYRGVVPYENTVWLGNSSRDTYDGFNFALATVWKHVEDQQVRKKVRRLVRRVGDRLVEDRFRILDGKGHTTRPTPWFKLSWQRLLLSVDDEHFAAIQTDYQESLQRLVGRGYRITPLTGREYFANNLRFIRMYVLCTLEHDPERAAGLQSVLREMFRQTKTHLNAHFAAIYIAGTGDTSNNDARALVQGLLIDYPQGPRWMGMIDQRNNAKINKQNERFALYALLPHERPAREFIWQRSPVVLHHGDSAVGGVEIAYEYPGYDLFLPYWMGRQTGVIPAP